MYKSTGRAALPNWLNKPRKLSNMQEEDSKGRSGGQLQAEVSERAPQEGATGSTSNECPHTERRFIQPKGGLRLNYWGVGRKFSASVCAHMHLDQQLVTSDKTNPGQKRKSKPWTLSHVYLYRKNGRQKHRVGERTAEFSSSTEVYRKCLKLKYPRRAIQAFVNDFTAMMVNETYELKSLNVCF